MKYGSGIRKIITGILIAVSMLFCYGGTAPAEGAAGDTTPLTNLIPGWPGMREIREASAVVMDADTGGILYSLNRDTIRYPASTTKILTALIVIEKAKLSDTVTMDDTGTEYVAQGSTNADTKNGEQFTVEQCLYIMLLKSANDIATQLGKHVGGSLPAFAEMMNQRAEEIGCTGSHFVNPSGMPDSDHYSTAADMALIMRECLKNDLFRKIIATRSYTVPPTNKTDAERVYDNHCSLIQPASEYYYEYCIGGKTGFTQAAWRTLVTAAVRDGRTLICVTMRGPDRSDYIDTAELFEYGFQNFENREIGGVKCTLPTGFDSSVLEKEEVSDSSGNRKTVWKYGKMPVGEKTSSALMNRFNAAEAAIIAAAVLLLCFLAAGGIHARRKRRRRGRKRR